MYIENLSAEYTPEIHQKIIALGFFQTFVSDANGVYIYYHEKKSTAGVELRTHTAENLTTLTISATGTFDTKKAQVFGRKLRKSIEITAQALL
jgi:hypothetical protein